MTHGWYPVGGAKAHARTLRVLGFSCQGETPLGYIMGKGGRVITLPKQPRLTSTTFNRICAMSGHSKAEYIDAWRRKTAQSLGCPPMSLPD